MSTSVTDNPSRKFKLAKTTEPTNDKSNSAISSEDNTALTIDETKTGASFIPDNAQLKPIVPPLPPFEFDGRNLAGDMRFTADPLQITGTAANSEATINAQMPDASTVALFLHDFANKLSLNEQALQQQKQALQKQEQELKALKQSFAQACQYFNPAGAQSQLCSFYPLACSNEDTEAPEAPEAQTHYLQLTINAQSSTQVTDLLAEAQANCHCASSQLQTSSGVIPLLDRGGTSQPPAAPQPQALAFCPLLGYQLQTGFPITIMTATSNAQQMASMQPTGGAANQPHAASQPQAYCPWANSLPQTSCGVNQLFASGSTQQPTSPKAKSTGSARRTKLACLLAKLDPNCNVWLEGSPIQQALKNKPNMSKEELAKLVYNAIYQHNPNIESFYFVVHDKDNTDPHFHALVEFTQQHLGCTTYELSEFLGIAELNIRTTKKGRYAKDNLLAYLIHAKEPPTAFDPYYSHQQTPKAKASYAPSEVVTVAGPAFDLVYRDQEQKWLNAKILNERKNQERTQQEFDKASKTDIAMMLDVILRGHGECGLSLKKFDYWSKLASLNPKQIQDAKEAYTEMYQHLICEASNMGLLKKSNLYVHGESGSGKTTFNRKFMSTLKQIAANLEVVWHDGLMLGGKHTMDHVGSRSVICLDEISLEDHNQAKDLLKLLDPNLMVSINSARYKDTTNSQLFTLWNSLNPIESEFSIVEANFKEDPEQFIRRFNYDVKIHTDHSVTIRPIMKVDGKSQPVFTDQWPDERLSMDEALEKLIEAYMSTATHFGLSKYNIHLVKGINGNQDCYLGIQDEHGHTFICDVSQALEEGKQISKLILEIARLTQDAPNKGVFNIDVVNLKNQLSALLNNQNLRAS